MGLRRWWASLIELAKTFFFLTFSLRCSYEALTSGSFCREGNGQEEKTEMTGQAAADGLIKLADAVKIVQELLVLIAGGFPLALE